MCGRMRGYKEWNFYLMRIMYEGRANICSGNGQNPKIVFFPYNKNIFILVVDSLKPIC